MTLDFRKKALAVLIPHDPKHLYSFQEVIFPIRNDKVASHWGKH
jgi:hypothetical protein